ncbi:DUF1640 domain-containing protein [Azospirillaceae bacterium]
MAVVAFDTLKLADRLQSGGFTAEQARTAALAFADAMSGAELATKSDLNAVKAELKADVAEVRNELKADVSEVRTELQATKAELKADIAEVRTELQATKAELKTDIALLSTRMDNMATRIEQQNSAHIERLEWNFSALSEQIKRSSAETDAKMMRLIVRTGVASVMAIVGVVVALLRYLH